MPAQLKRKLVFAALIPVLALLALAGCGGGDEEEQPEITAVETTASQPSLSREEIIAQGDAICAEVSAAVAGVMASDATPATQLSQRTDLYTSMIERLRGLDSEDPDLTSVFSAGRDLVQAAAEAESAATAGDSQAAAAAETTVAAALSAFETAASNYGFSECGGDASPVIVPGSGDEGGGGEVTPKEPATGGEVAPVEPEPTPPAGGAPATGTDGGDTGGGAAPGGDGGGTGGDGGGAGGGGGNTGGISPTG